MGPPQASSGPSDQPETEPQAARGQDEPTTKVEQDSEGGGAKCAHLWQSPTGSISKSNVILIKQQQQQKPSYAQTYISNTKATTSTSECHNFDHSHHQQIDTMLTGGPERNGAAASSMARPTLVDMLIDSQLDWRRLISEANDGLNLNDYLSPAQIRRQELVHELIQTERHHCLTLALMRQVYLAGLLRLNEHRNKQTSGAGSGQTGNATFSDSSNHQAEPVDIERLFPALEELIQAHELFFAHLRLRLVDCCSRDRHLTPLIGVIGPLGDLLVDQFKLADSGRQQQAGSELEMMTRGDKLPKYRNKANKSRDSSRSGTLRKCPSSSAGATGRLTNGQKLLQAYAKFCGQHYESSRYFKQLMQHDAGFKQFIEQCNKQHAACRQRGIPECNLLVAQRLTKYPLLIEQLIKTSKDELNDEETKLKRALDECRALLAELNAQLARKESFERLLDIYAQFSPKSYTIFNHKSAFRFTKHDLLQHKRLRQLLHADDQIRIWSATRRKLFPILCLILDDIVAFLRVEQNSNHHHHHNSAHQLLPGAVSQLSDALSQPQGLLNHQSCEPIAAASFQAQSVVSGAAVAPQMGNGASQLQAQHQQQVAYYFANIDNKSSVISLSKLLVREKAVEDPEPRVYLISSSPKQPEMYELAFMTRRHQANFIDKLRTAIERHGKHKAIGENSHRKLAVGPATNLTNSSSLCCSLTSATATTCSVSEPSASSMNSLLESSECSESSLCSSAAASSSGPLSSSNSTCDLDQNDDDDDELDNEQDDEEDKRTVREETSEEVAQAANGQVRGQQQTPVDAGQENSTPVLRRANSMRRNKLPRNGASHLNWSQTKVAKSPTMPDKLDKLVEDLDNLELDIEQGLPSGPPPSRPSSPSGERSPCEKLATESRDALGAPPVDAEPSCQQASRATSPEDEDQQLPGGLSGRARDSCDDLSSIRLYQTGGSAPGAGQAKSSYHHHRRRRFQRPRQVSNQSSDSCQSSATSGASLTSGLGTTTGDETTAGDGASDGKPQLEEELDSGRGQDDSSSSSSASCNDSMSLTTAKTCDERLAREHQTPVRMEQQPTEESISSRATHSDDQTKTTTTNSDLEHEQQQQQQRPLDSLPVKRNLLKQRKLSTASTISNQKRLMQKLRSVGLLAGSQQQHQVLPESPEVVCQGCRMREEAFGGEPNIMMLLERRHQQQLRRRSLFIPEQKLEELRNLRIQLDKDKSEWQKKFDRMQEQLLNERRDLDLAREQLKRDRLQIDNERQQLYRKLDILKENGILLSPSHKVIITVPESCPAGSASCQPPRPPAIGQQHLVQVAPGGQQNQMAQHYNQPSLSVRVPVHLSQQPMAPSPLVQTSQQHRSSLIGVLPGASFLVRRFGGGGGASATSCNQSVAAAADLHVASARVDCPRPPDQALV